MNDSDPAVRRRYRRSTTRSNGQAALTSPRSSPASPFTSSSDATPAPNAPSWSPCAPVMSLVDRHMAERAAREQTIAEALG